MRTKHTALLALVMLASSTMACTDDSITKGNENIETGNDILNYGELLPGPDYQASNDPAYRQTIMEQGGPTSPSDWTALDRFESAMDDASSVAYRSLPTFVAEEFPGLTESERNALIGDFQAAVATGFRMRDKPNSADCVEIYATNNAGTLEWQPVCDGQFGPEFKGRIGKIVRWLGERAWQGRDAVKTAAVSVANFATRQAGNARRIAGEVVRVVKDNVVAAGNRAAQMAGAARMYAGQGWNYVKQKYAQANFWQKLVVESVAWEAGEYVVGGVYNWFNRQLFGGPTETQTTDAARSLGGDSNANIDVLFDM